MIDDEHPYAEHGPWAWTTRWPAACPHLGSFAVPGETKIVTCAPECNVGVRACRKFGGFVMPMDCHRKCPGEFPEC